MKSTTEQSNPQVRDYNLRFIQGSNHNQEYLLDLRDNQPLHTGFSATNYWESIHATASEASPLLATLLSGAHSMLNIHIGSTFMDKAMLQREISVTFHSSL